MIGRLLARRYGRDLEAAGRGQALVETALVMTLILLLALATLDLGRGLGAHLALTEATQEGAIYAAHRRYSPTSGSDPNAAVTNAQIQSRVRSSSSSDAVANANVSVSCSGARVTVTSTHNLPTVSPVARAVFGPNFTLSVSSRANILRGTCP